MQSVGLVAQSAEDNHAIATLIFGAALLLVPFIGGEFMPHLDEGRALGAGDHALHHFF
jgi:Cu/Ag efflux pump CusA